MTLPEAKVDASFKDFVLIAVAALITAGERHRLTRALQNANTAMVSDVSNNNAQDEYYVAFVPTVSGPTSIHILNYSLTKDQAKAVLTYSSLREQVLSTHGIDARKYGIYTQTYSAAFALATEMGATTDPENHNNATKTGLYYEHFHGPNHEYHIWYGLPQ